MRGKLRKDINRYVIKTFPMIPEDTSYRVKPNGVIILNPMCRRAIRQNIKHNYVKMRRGELNESQRG